MAFLSCLRNSEIKNTFQIEKVLQREASLFYRLPCRQNPLEWELMDLTAAFLSASGRSKFLRRNFLRQA